MTTIYRKTAQGASEIETRANKLPPRLRSTLILVDGRRSVAELRPFIGQQPDEALAALLARGFIEAAPAPALPRATARPAPSDLGQHQREVVRALTDAVGPIAETLAMRIERTRSADEMRPLIEQARQLIAGTRGNDKAAAFALRFSGR